MYCDFPSESEDFAAYAVEHIMQGRRASIGHLFIDYCRENFGARRNASGRIRSEANLSVAEFDEGLHHDPTNNPTTLDTGLLEGVPSEVRCAYILHYEWGLTLEEIARCFGILKTTLEKRMTYYHRTIKRNITKSE